MHVAPTRDYCAELFTPRIHATINNTGDTIGWGSDDNVIEPVDEAAK